MARNKEALVLLLDVGPSMHGVLPEVESVCSLLVQKKLIFNKSDEVGIVLFGTDDTDNELEKEVGGYEHVVVLHGIKVVEEGMMEAVKSFSRGTSPGDFVDAIVVGIDMMLKKYGCTNKGKKRLCLITDALYPTKGPYEGTKEDQIDTITQQMNAHGIGLDCFIIRGNPYGSVHLKTIEENIKLLDYLSRKTKAKIVHIHSPLSLLGAIRTRNISPVTVFRGDLELSSRMKIKVWVYKKTSEERFPTLKRYSDKAPPTDKHATHEVKVDYEYKSLENPDKVIPPEQRIKGYCYGPQVVPISSADWDAVKFKPEKGVKLLGFANTSDIMRHYYMKDVYIFIPEPGNRKAITAISALARAMKEMNRCGILRCVWRQGQGSVVLGALTPNVSSLHNMSDSFYFNILPFMEDIREFQFPSLNNLPPSWQPTESQQEASDNFVRMLDLAPPGREVLQPDYTPNPVLQRFYHFIDMKKKQPDSDVPQLGESLKEIAEPNKDMLCSQKYIIDNFQKQFELRGNPKKKKSSRPAWREKTSALSEEEDIEPPLLYNYTTSKGLLRTKNEKIEKIGDLNPVKDFEAMISRRDSSKWVSKAIQDMENYIALLVENSFEGDAFPKAIECLVALRKGCILEQEPNEFNRYLQELYQKWYMSDLDFFKHLSLKNITLISKSEAADSDLTEEEAKHFLAKLNHSD